MGQAGPGAVTERFQGRSSRRLGRRSERSQVGGDEVGTLAGEGALEQGRRQGGRARQRPAYGVVDGLRGGAGGAVGREPAAQHVVAQGRQPVAAADQVGDGVGVDGAGDRSQ